eukprot:2755194-Rhodomonas_salina.1
MVLPATANSLRRRPAGRVSPYAMLLRTPYEMSGTERRYAATRHKKELATSAYCYAMCGTELAYSATRWERERATWEREKEVVELEEE